MGESTGTAGQHLRLLEGDLATRPAPRDGQPRARATRPGAPLDLGVLDYLEATGRELAAIAQALAPGAAPVPSRPASAALEAFEANTAHLAGRQARIRDEILLRQQLEATILAGDHLVVRPLECPNCCCLGLVWQRPIRKAVCVNRFCARARGGVHAAWSLADLARHEVANRKGHARTAT